MTDSPPEASPTSQEQLVACDVSPVDTSAMSSALQYPESSTGHGTHSLGNVSIDAASAQ